MKPSKLATDEPEVEFDEPPPVVHSDVAISSTDNLNRDTQPLARMQGRSTSRLKLGTRSMALTPADMVIPLCCGVCSHLVLTGLLVGCLLTYNELTECNLSNQFIIYLICSLSTHVLTILVNSVSTMIAFRIQVLSQSKLLNCLLNFRMVLNIIECLLVIWGILLIFFNSSNYSCIRKDESTNNEFETLLMIAVFSNVGLIYLTWCTVFCISKNSADYNRSMYYTHNPESRHNQIFNVLRRFCKFCFWEQRHSRRVDEAYSVLGSLLTILVRGNPHDTLHLAPSDIVTGLNLLKMLQKHYGLFDKRFYQPLAGQTYKFYKDNTGNETIELKINENWDKDSIEYKKSKSAIRNQLYKGKQPIMSNDEQAMIGTAAYYMNYCQAAYGIALYSLSNPCAICCALPCGVPSNLGSSVDVSRINEDELRYKNHLIRDNPCCWCSCCCCSDLFRDKMCSLSNSSLKVFLKRCNLNANDILIVHHSRHLNSVHFVVCADRRKEKLVIAIRGTESIPDSVTDADTNPKCIDEIDEECHVHTGILSSTREVYDIIINHVCIGEFLKQHPNYGVVVTGHSLGGGVTVLLTLLLTHGSEKLRNEILENNIEENENKNENDKSNLQYFKDRDVHGYALAPPGVVCKKYADMIREESEKYLTCFIFSKDLVPRLSWVGIIRIRAAINRLLKICNKSVWFSFLFLFVIFFA